MCVCVCVCVCTSTRSYVYISCVMHVWKSELGDGGIRFKFNFYLKKLVEGYEKKRATESTISELQLADDAAFVAESSQSRGRTPLI